MNKKTTIISATILVLLGLTVTLWYTVFAADPITSTQSGNWSTGSTWVGGVAPGESDDVVIANGHTVTLTGTGSVTVNSVTIESGGILEHDDNTTSKSNIINIITTAGFDVQSGGSIDVDGLGYSGGTQGNDGNGSGGGLTGSGCCGGGAGGSHGGIGGDGSSNGTPGDTYGSYTAPIDLGSGGAGGRNTGAGTDGGGAIILTVGGTMTIDGTITAEGSTANAGGAGSGGSVYITADSFDGSGSVSADGGENTYSASGASGAGGGGRVSLVYTTSDSFSGSVSAEGGPNSPDPDSKGSEGTVVRIDQNAGDDDFYLDSGTITISSNTTYNNFTITSATSSVDSGIELTISGTFDAPNAYLSGTGTVSATNTTISGNSYVDIENFSGGVGTIENGGILTKGGTDQYSFSSLTIESGGTLTHDQNTTSKDHVLDLSISGNLDVQSGGSIDVDGLGYSGGTQGNDGNGSGGGLTGTGCCGGGAGASYGGVGGPGSAGGTEPGGVYGSYSAPIDLGSGGAGGRNTGNGSDGGGAIILNISGTMTVNGAVSADGAPAAGAGSGSGGSVYITVGRLEGSSSISANGGSQGSNGSGTGGGGGGGRVAIYFSVANTLSGSIAASGGVSSVDSDNSGLEGTVLIDRPEPHWTRSSAGANNILTNDLVGHWTFDGPDVINNITDVSSNRSHGSLFGQATSTAPGKANQAFDFNGSGRIEVADNANISTGDIDFALGFWVKFDSFSNDTGIVAKWTGVDNQREFATYYSSGVFQWHISWDGTNSSALNSSLTPVVGRWYYMYGEHDSVNNTRTFKIYDATAGTLTTDSEAFSSGGFDSTEELIFGKYGGGNELDGQIDDVRLWKRTLTDSELSSLYERTVGLTRINSGGATNNVLTSGLVGHYTFDGPDMFENVSDVSGQGNDAHLCATLGASCGSPNATSTFVIAGKTGQGLRLAGDGNRGSRIGDSAFFQPGTGEFTISGWIKTNLQTSSGCNVGSNIIGSWYLGQGSIDVLLLGVGHGCFGGATSGQPRLMYRESGSTGAVVGSTLVNDGQWHLITVTRSGTNAVIYVDGVEDGSDTLAGGLDWDFPNNNPWSIGEGSGFSSAEGLIDDVRVYNRALSASEVKSLYNATK